MESMQVDEGEEIPQLENTVEEADESLPTTANNEFTTEGYFTCARGGKARRGQSIEHMMLTCQLRSTCSAHSPSARVRGHGIQKADSFVG